MWNLVCKNTIALTNYNYKLVEAMKFHNIIDVIKRIDDEYNTIDEVIQTI